MPPKFHPPRPTSTSSTSKKPGRPKGSTSKPSNSGVKKPTVKGKGKAKDGRNSAPSLRDILPSLSPDSSEGGSEVESEDGQRGRNGKRKSEVVEIDGSEEEERRENRRGEERGMGARRKESIPTDLLAVLLNSMLKNEGSKMSTGASRAAGMYFDTFLREGVARAAWAVAEEGGGGVLEVEALEKLAPQLLLDF